MPKIKVFLWQLCHNVLPVKGILARRGCNVDPQCPLCATEIESIHHLFWDCHATKRVWDLAVQHHWILPHLLGHLNNEWPSTLRNVTKISRLSEIQKFSFLLWIIWKGRNAVIFQNENFNPLVCIIKAKQFCVEWRIRSCLLVEDFLGEVLIWPTTTYKLVQWEPPPSGTVKLNFDGSMRNTSTAGGYIIRDWQDTVLRAGSQHHGDASIIMAEVRALRDGVRAAAAAGYMNILIEGDN